MAIDRLHTEIADHLMRYVYALVDPRDGIPFYIGKGTGARVLQHGLDAAQWAEDDSPQERHEKFARIREIERAGHEVEVWILRRGMTSAEYSVVEATLIDMLRTFPITPLRDSAGRNPLVGGTELTNRVRGSDTEQGIARLRDIERDFRAPDLTTCHPLLLITLKPWTEVEEPLPGGGVRQGFGFKSEWTDRRQLDRDIALLGESVCCWWTFRPARVEQAGITHMVALYRGVTRGLFRIVPGTGKTVPSKSSTGKPTTRSGYTVEPVLTGPLWDETIGPYGYRVAKKPGEQAQFRYWPYA